MNEIGIKLVHSLLLFLILIPIELISQDSIDELAATNDASAEKYLKDGNKSEAARLYNQTAYQYRQKGNVVKSIEYYKKVLALNIDLENIKGQILTHTNLSMLYIEIEQYEKALVHLEEELKFRKQTKNPKEIIPVIISIAGAENALKRFEKASSSAQKAIDKSLEINDLPLLKRAYGIMFDIYTQWGKQEKAQSYFEQYSAIDKKLKEMRMAQIQNEAKEQINEANFEKVKTQDSLKTTSEELKVTSVSLKEAKHVAQQQEMELNLQQALINGQQALIRLEKMRKTYFAIAFCIALAFVIVLVFLILRIRNANKEISLQKLKLEKQNQQIRASIRYAETIQNAMLPDLSRIEYLTKPFIIYRPKDIVSGDFYWAKKISETRLFFAVVDCTGHGVPGAFMSMIGMRMLNEIVNELKVISPAVILENLNERLRDALRQEQTDNNDGMDLAIIRLDKLAENQYEIIYSGAKRPLYIGRKEEQVLQIYKPDRKSIGGYQSAKKRVEFSNKKILVSSGDAIYMFSDGITDQNNLERKKFGSQRLEKLLQPLSKEQGVTQAKIINEDLDNFSQGAEQRDDITFSGLILK